MIILRSSALNFKNLHDIKINWSPGINLILGSNGAGKTNLLESLNIMAGWGSFTKISELITWNSNLNYSYLSAKISGEADEDLNINAKISGKIILRLDQKFITSTNMRFLIPSLCFLPGNINLIDGSPSVRRLFIDKLCALFYPAYAKRLAEFKLISRNRSALLKQNKSPNITNIPFCKLGGWIMQARRDLILNLKNNNLVTEITPNINNNINCAEYLYNELKKFYSQEISTGRILTGPNFDDLIINFNGRSAEFLSRGQKRILILNLIISAADLIILRLKRKPVLFFDDLTAELDKNAKSKTYEKLLNTGLQIFITASENPFNIKNPEGYTFK